MKKIILMIIAAAFVFVGCKKEEAANNGYQKAPTMSNELEELYKQVPIVDFGKITLLNGEILRFESSEHYERVYEGLKMQCDAWNALFYGEYDTGNVKELDEAIETLGFDEFMPLRKFEEKYKTVNNNLRTKNQVTETNWLKAGGVGKPPFDGIVICPIEQALYSSYHEAAVGDTIVQRREGGFEVYIHVSNVKDLNIIRNATKEQFTSKVGGIAGLSYSPSFYDPWVDTDSYDDPPQGNVEQYFANFSNDGMKKTSSDSNYDYKFHWKYSFTYTKVCGTKSKAVLTNYRKPKGSSDNNYVKSAAVCGLWVNTHVYKDLGTTDLWGNPKPPVEMGWVQKGTTIITKKIERTKSADPDCYAYDNNSKKQLRDRVTSSYVDVRHYGVVYRINVYTKDVVVIPK